MWTHLLHLLHRSLGNMWASGGSTLPGYAVIGIIGIILGFLCTAFFEWARSGRNASVFKSTLKTWPAYAGAAAGLTLAWMFMFLWSICSTIYGDHQELVKSDATLRAKQSELEQKIGDLQKQLLNRPTELIHTLKQPEPRKCWFNEVGTVSQTGGMKSAMQVLISCNKVTPLPYDVDISIAESSAPIGNVEYLMPDVGGAVVAGEIRKTGSRSFRIKVSGISPLPAYRVFMVRLDTPSPDTAAHVESATITPPAQ